MKKVLLIVCWAWLPFGAFSQSFPLGLNPSNLKWQQINTDKVQVVFPAEIEEEGQRVANLIHYLSEHDLETIGEKTGKITILLQNQTTIPNGFVSLGPFRSEFFMTPPQFNLLGTGDWLDLLAIHEYRHVLQITNARRGLTGLFSTLLGQNALTLFRRVALPRWYLEGDAILTETGYTTSGRGRLPSFNMQYKALRLNGLDYNYEKASAGSLKDYVPDHYALGYYLTAHARRKYGAEIWQDVFTHSVKYKSPLFPFSMSLKKFTGKRVPQFYEETMGVLDSVWEAQDEALPLTPFEQLTKTDTKTYTTYKNPHFLTEDLILTEKASYKQINRFQLVDRNGGEKKLFIPGITYSPERPISVRNGKLVWAEAVFHPRWGYENYSVIKMAELPNLNGVKKAETLGYYLAEPVQLTKKTRYFSPSLSWGGERIVTVNAPTDLDYALVILNSSNGNVLQELPNPNGYFYSFPHWLEGDQKIAVVAQKAHSQALLLVDPKTGAEEVLIGFHNEQILNPYPRGEYIYFSGSHTGTNNIFAIHRETRETFQLTSSKLGAFQPSVSADGKTLLYSEFTPYGYQVSRRELSPSAYQPVVLKKVESGIAFYKPLIEQSGGSILDDVKNEEYEVKKYSKGANLLNPHSLQPFIAHPNYSIEVQSDDKMTTTQAAAGYSYNVNEENGGFYGRIRYAEFFPVFEAEARVYGTRERLAPYLGSEVTEEDTVFFRGLYVRDWREQDYRLGVTLPLNLTRGNHFSQLQLGMDYHFIKADYRRSALERFEERLGDSRDEWFNTLNFRMRFSRIQNRARQNINSRFGQVVDLRYMTTLGQQNNQGSLFRALGTFLFPGVSYNHSAFVQVGYQQELLTNTYMFRDNYFYPRGYPSIIHDRIRTIGVNYSLPLVYPDMALGPFAFLQRIKANFFLDYAYASLGSMQTEDMDNNSEFDGIQGAFTGRSLGYTSTGVEISFDFRALRLIEMSLGARYSYLYNADRVGINNHQFDFIVLGIGNY